MFFPVAGALVLAWILYARFGTKPVPSSAPPEVVSRLLIIKESRLHQIDSTEPFMGWMLETNAFGGLQSRSFVSNGFLEGVSEGFFTNGQRQVLEHFRAGVSHGKRTKWHPNGVRASEATVVQGRLHDRFLAWHEDGSLAQEVLMKEGQPHGRSRSFYPSGYLKAESMVLEGKVTEQHFWEEGERRNP